MITRAIIENISTDTAVVRIPIFDGLNETVTGYTLKKDLSTASILCVPGIDVNYKPGDIVIVGFQDNDVGRPIILGHLKSSYTSKNLEENEYPTIHASNLLVSGNSKLSADTSIGNVSSDRIQNIDGSITNENIDSLFE